MKREAVERMLRRAEGVNEVGVMPFGGADVAALCRAWLALDAGEGEGGSGDVSENDRETTTMSEINSKGIEMLSLPEPAAGYGRGCNIELADGQPLYTAEQVRACVSSATEALRAEVDQYKRRAAAYFQTAERQGQEAVRLAEALRKIERGAPDEMPDVGAWSDADEKAEVAENLVHWLFAQIAREALRKYDQEVGNG